MVNILLNGCNGAMGKAVTESVNKRDDADIVAGIDIFAEMHSHFPVFNTVSDFKNTADVIIDFSHPGALTPILTYAVSAKVPIVIATTGLSEKQVERINEASKKIPVFFSANMSLGISLISQLATKAASVLGMDFDIEIVEAHHNNKLDAPSGTALLLADTINKVFKEPLNYEYDRHSKRVKRPKNEIGIHSIRGGTIVGNHDVIFAGEDEIITVSHSALTKSVFAAGAVKAAVYLTDKSEGLYTMQDLVSEL